MDRLVAADGPVMIFGHLNEDERIPLTGEVFASLAICNLGPSHLYLTALVVADQDGNHPVRLRWHQMIAPAASEVLFDNGTIASLRDQLELVEDMRKLERHLSADFIQMGCEAFSSHGEHSLRWPMHLGRQNFRLPDAR